MIVREANATDWPQVADLFLATPVRSGTSFVLDRRPDFCALPRMRGEFRTFVASQGERLAGTVTALWHRARDGGGETTVGEVIDLRIAPWARGGRVAFRLLHAVREVFAGNGVEWVTCLIGKQNHWASAITARGVGLPPLKPLEEFASVHFMALRTPAAPRSVVVRAATPDDAPLIAAFLEDQKASERFAPTADIPWPDPSGSHRAWIAFGRDGSPRGALIAWDGEAARRLRIVRYRMADLPLRAVMRVGSVLGLSAAPPAPGEVLRLWATRLVAVRSGGAETLRALIGEALRSAVAEGRNVLQVNLGARDPLLRQLPLIPGQRTGPRSMEDLSMNGSYPGTAMASASMSTSLEPEARPAPYVGRLMFTQSWEDPACDLAALRPQPAETILAITSGCDNVLGFLLTDPARVIAVDINPSQTWLFELKRAAFATLTHAEVRVLFGIDRGDAAQLYQRLRPKLSRDARAFWDADREWLARGLLVTGGFERYFAMLRRLLSITLGRARLERLFSLEPAQQRAFYDNEWNTRAWRALIGAACSKWVLGRKLDASWFAHSEASGFGAHFTGLAAHAVADLPARSNYFLAQILLGRYVDAENVPDYLRPENFDTIRKRLDRVTTVTADISGGVEALPSRSVDCFALSNVFEYSPRSVFERTCGEILRVAKPGARLALRNLFAPRRLSESPGFCVDPVLSERLRDADRGFIYSVFEAATLKEGSS